MRNIRYFSTELAASLSGLPAPTLRALSRAGLIQPTLPATAGMTKGHGWGLPNIVGLCALRNLRLRGVPLKATAAVSQAIGAMQPSDLDLAFADGRRFLLFCCDPPSVYPELLTDAGVRASMPEFVDAQHRGMGVCVFDLRAAVDQVQCAIAKLDKRKGRSIAADAPAEPVAS